MRSHHKRRQRRTAKQQLNNHGIKNAKRRHARRGGRTGSIRSKRARPKLTTGLAPMIGIGLFGSF